MTDFEITMRDEDMFTYIHVFTMAKTGLLSIKDSNSVFKLVLLVCQSIASVLKTVLSVPGLGEKYGN